MPTTQDLLARKGSHVLSICPSATVLEATRLMNQHKVGSLLVTDPADNDRMVGIFTERDVLRRVVAEQRDPAETPVGEVMSGQVICCRPQTDLEDAARIMRDRRIRHLPVCDDDGRLLGMISIGDLNAFDLSDKEMTIHFLSDYIYGRV